MSNVIPDGWSNPKLDDIVTKFQNGYAFSAKGYVPEGIPIISMGSIQLDGTFKKNNTKLKYWDAAAKEDLSRYLVKSEDLIMAMTDVTPTMELIGRACIVKGNGEYFLNQRVGLISVDEEKSSKPFLSYLTNFNQWRSYCIGSSGLGAQANLGTSQILDGSILLPPLPEQQKIAAILSSVDEVIEKTQAQIRKLKDLKTGMMQELLSPREGQAANIHITQGESKNGLHHTEFKDSPLGRIPVGWEVVSLGQTGKWSGGGTPSKANKEFWGGNIPWVSPKDMKVEFINRTQDYITEEAISNSSTNMVKEGSLLMVVRSGILQHTLPLAIAARDLTLNQDMKALSVTEGYSAVFIYNYLEANNHKVLRATLKAGNTVESLDFNEFSNYLIPCPPPKEQEYIVKVVGAVAKNLRDKSSQLINYKNLKKALMQDLLTGKVRVKVDAA